MLRAAECWQRHLPLMGESKNTMEILLLSAIGFVGFLALQANQRRIEGEKAGVPPAKAPDAPLKSSAPNVPAPSSLESIIDVGTKALPGAVAGLAGLGSVGAAGGTAGVVGAGSGSATAATAGVAGAGGAGGTGGTSAATTTAAVAAGTAATVAVGLVVVIVVTIVIVIIAAILNAIGVAAKNTNKRLHTSLFSMHAESLAYTGPGRIRFNLYEAHAAARLMKSMAGFEATVKPYYWEGMHYGGTGANDLICFADFMSAYPAARQVRGRLTGWPSDATQEKVARQARAEALYFMTRRHQFLQNFLIHFPDYTKDAISKINWNYSTDAINAGAQQMPSPVYMYGFDVAKTYTRFELDGVDGLTEMKPGFGFGAAELENVGYPTLAAIADVMGVMGEFGVSVSEDVWTKALEPLGARRIRANTYLLPYASWAFRDGAGNKMNGILRVNVSAGEEPLTFESAGPPEWSEAPQVLPGLETGLKVVSVEPSSLAAVPSFGGFSKG